MQFKQFGWQSPLTPLKKMQIFIYIYIYIQREREREREIYADINR